MNIYEFEDLEEGIYPVLLGGQSRGFDKLVCELVVKRNSTNKIKRFIRENSDENKAICHIEVLGSDQFDLTFNNYGFETNIGLLTSEITLIVSNSENPLENTPQTSTIH